MNHLIIGAGNMGTRHYDILSSLGDYCWSIDTDIDKKSRRCIAEWEGTNTYLKRFNWSWPHSVLICTPPETHVELINQIPPEIPVFCEKPLLVDLKQVIQPRKAPTLMACNWLWCDCVKDILTTPKADEAGIICYYRSKDKYRSLDLLHFLILFKEYFEVESIEYISVSDNNHTLHFNYLKETRPALTAMIYFNAPVLEQDRVYASFKLLGNGKSACIHTKGPCDMFVKQMRHWRQVIANKEKSRLDFEAAEQLNREILELIK